MICEVWDKKRGQMVEINDKDRLIAYKRDDFSKKIVVEPAKLTGETNKHFMFITESGTDILVNKNSANDDSVDCFYSNKNSWSISLNNFAAFEELI
ncbi:MAG: hypothetical protein FWC91_07910 [Defluviitaleaceae bacterium]|nr:hypothetical protein [Defluviitaleaceae bacterium]